MVTVASLSRHQQASQHQRQQLRAKVLQHLYQQVLVRASRHQRQQLRVKVPQHQYQLAKAYHSAQVVQLQQVQAQAVQRVHHLVQVAQPQRA